MAILGETGISDTKGGLWYDRAHILQITAPEDGEVTKAWVFADTNVNEPPLGQKFIISDSDGNTITNGISNVENWDSVTDQWHSFTFPTNPTISNGSSYYIYILQSTNGGGVWRDDSPTGDYFVLDSGGMSYSDPQSFDTGEIATFFGIPSLFIEYTPAGGEALLGETGIGDIQGGLWTDRAQILLITAPENGEVIKGWVYADCLNSQKFIITDDTGSIITNGISDIESYTGEGWYSFTFPTNPTISNGSSYYIYILQSSTGGGVYEQTSPLGPYFFYPGENYSSPQGFDTADIYSFHGKPSIYIEYISDEAPPSGYSNSIFTVPSANIGKVFGVDTANINKVFKS